MSIKTVTGSILFTGNREKENGYNLPEPTAERGCNHEKGRVNLKKLSKSATLRKMNILKLMTADIEKASADRGNQYTGGKSTALSNSQTKKATLTQGKTAGKTAESEVNNGN